MYEYSELEKIWSNLVETPEMKGRPQYPNGPTPQDYGMKEDQDNRRSDRENKELAELKKEVYFLKRDLDKIHHKYEHVLHLLHLKEQELSDIDQYLSRIEKLVEFLD